MEQSEKLNKLYELFGRTSENAQTLELEAGNVILSYLTLFVDPKNITNEEKKEYKKLVDEVDSKTLGNLLKTIKSIVNFDQKSEDIINKALNRRNYLIHHFFKTHNFAIFSEKGKDEMIIELEGISKELSLAKLHLDAISKLMAKVAGREDISTEKITEFINKGEKLKI